MTKLKAVILFGNEMCKGKKDNKFREKLAFAIVPQNMTEICGSKACNELKEISALKPTITKSPFDITPEQLNL